MEVNVIGKIVPSELFASAHEDEALVNRNDPRNNFVPVEDVVGSDESDIIEYISTRERLMNRLKNNTRNRDHKINRKTSSNLDCQIMVMSKDSDEIGVECQHFIGAASIVNGEVVYSENIAVDIKEELRVYMAPERIGINKSHCNAGKHLTDIIGLKRFFKNSDKENLKTMPIAKLQRLSRAELREYRGKF
ncbi:MAG: hypothetical protein WCK37_01525 [Candidatus Falkowbacteria bacterium]